MLSDIHRTPLRCGLVFINTSGRSADRTTPQPLFAHPPLHFSFRSPCNHVGLNEKPGPEGPEPFPRDSPRSGRQTFGGESPFNPFACPYHRTSLAAMRPFRVCLLPLTDRSTPLPSVLDASMKLWLAFIVLQSIRMGIAQSSESCGMPMR